MIGGVVFVVLVLLLDGCGCFSFVVFVWFYWIRLCC